MKKLLSLLFVAGMFAFVSCGGSENKNNASNDSAAAASKADSMLKMSADTTHKMMGSDSSKMATDTTKKM